jgi:hypothetical protein
MYGFAHCFQLSEPSPSTHSLHTSQCFVFQPHRYDHLFTLEVCENDTDLHLSSACGMSNMSQYDSVRSMLHQQCMRLFVLCCCAGSWNLCFSLHHVLPACFVPSPEWCMLRARPCMCPASSLSQCSSVLSTVHGRCGDMSTESGDNDK